MNLKFEPIGLEKQKDAAMVNQGVLQKQIERLTTLEAEIATLCERLNRNQRDDEALQEWSLPEHPEDPGHYDHGDHFVAADLQIEEKRWNLSTPIQIYIRDDLPQSAYHRERCSPCFITRAACFRITPTNQPAIFPFVPVAG